MGHALMPCLKVQYVRFHSVPNSHSRNNSLDFVTDEGGADWCLTFLGLAHLHGHVIHLQCMIEIHAVQRFAGGFGFDR